MNNESSISISIVLSTYNGVKYVGEQLDSLCLQTRPAQEILIIDDASIDGTKEVICQYICEHNKIPFSFSSNPINRGWQTNFYNLITSAKGEIIFLCDQDDIWHSNKLAKMMSVMSKHPDINVLACAVEPFYEDGNSARLRYTDQPEHCVFTEGVCLVELNAWSLYIRRPGCSYCVRKQFIEDIAPYWNPCWPHDATIWRFAAATTSLAIMDEKLMRFRRHANNASGRKKITLAKRVDDVNYYLSMLRSIEKYGTTCKSIAPSEVDFIHEAMAWLDARLHFLQKRSPRDLSRMIRRRDFYATHKGLLVDLFLGVFRRMEL